MLVASPLLLESAPCIHLLLHGYLRIHQLSVIVLNWRSTTVALDCLGCSAVHLLQITTKLFRILIELLGDGLQSLKLLIVGRCVC